VTLRERVQSARENSVAMLPVGYEHGWRRHCSVAAGTLVFLLLRLNELLIERWGPEIPPVWDTDTLPWIAELEAALPEIQAEFDRFVAVTSELPQTAEYSGMDPDSEAAKRSVPLGEGRWRSVVLGFMGHWYPTVEHFPVATRLTRGRKGLQTAGFSCLEPHSHIIEHRDPNKGALRYQLPIHVPGEHGDCRIRVMDETIDWTEGDCILFDLNVPHEVWNDSDGFRVLFAGEVVMPLPFPLSVVNRLTQWSFRYFPSFQGIHGRTERLYADAGV